MADGPNAYADHVQRALKIPNTQKVLLAIAWCTDDKRHMASLFPEIMGVNVQKGTW